MTSKRAIADDNWRISDALWERIAPYIPSERPKPKGGRPRMPDRQAMDAILCVARTGCQWNMLPRRLGASSTVHDRFQEWRAAGVFRHLWRASVLEYDTLKGLDLEWQALDGAMTKAPLGAEKNRAQSNGSGQEGRQALVADRWQGHSIERGD